MVRLPLQTAQPSAALLGMNDAVTQSMNADGQILLRVTSDRQLAEEWELVLLAQGLSPSLGQDPDGVVLRVPPAEVSKALASLSAYERENRYKPTAQSEPMSPGSILSGLAAGLMLLLFYFITVLWLPVLPWLARGSADAERILQGELWRTVTALTLHADVAHVLSNAVAAAVFVSAVASLMGVGLGAALVLLAGAGGNLVNAILRGAPHVAVGASTAVFGAVGVLAGLALTRRRQSALNRRRAWLPVAAALALLGMLGAGGGRVDIWAHLLGLLVGALQGILVALVTPRAPLAPVQWSCGAAAVALIIYSWITAFP